MAGVENPFSLISGHPSYGPINGRSDPFERGYSWDQRPESTIEPAPDKKDKTRPDDSIPDEEFTEEIG